MNQEDPSHLSDLPVRLRELANDDQTSAEFSVGFVSEAGYQRGLETSRGLLREVGHRVDAFGDYRLTGILRVRGNTTLYLATDHVSLDSVVLKVLNFEPESFREARERFEREAVALSQLKHPRIVRFIEGQIASDGAYLVMEKIDGCDLAELVTRHGPLPCPTVRRIGFQIAEALVVVDNAGLVHRDVKPSNVMLTRDGEVKLIDFGIARQMESDDSTLTRDDQILGTIDFMAPEQVLDASAADIRSDLYGLGCTLLFLLTGRKPFEAARGGNAIRTAIAHVSTPLPSLIEMRPDIEMELVTIVERLCAKTPAQRLATPREAAAELERQWEPPHQDRLRDQIADVAEMRSTRSPLPVVGPVKDPTTKDVFTRSRTLQTKADSSRAVIRRWQWSILAILSLTLSAGAFWLFNEASKRDVIVNSAGMKLVRIPAGEFVMGSHLSSQHMQSMHWWYQRGFDQMRPQHRVKITRDFYVGMTEVTQGQWLDVMGNDHHWNTMDPTEVPVGDSFPASLISWHDANEFCRRLSDREGRRYRLPTEAEWEYFARAGTQTLHSYGEDFQTKYGWVEENTALQSLTAQPVGMKPPNPWGLYDTYGNVAEWCSDWYDPEYYSTDSKTDPLGPATGTEKVIRGGCYLYNRVHANSVVRNHNKPEVWWTLYGFRVVMEIE